MTQLANLYKKLTDNRQLTFAEFERLLRAFGFELDRIRGSHHIYLKRGLPERINAQPDGKMAKTYQLRRFADMIEAYGLMLEDDR
ncbi:type II toxin-antitoxin system HicA family toxin [Sphingomonas gilva]|nr:type II toxin-antitoxin system HicA family toxin [Sphingomonas gilva]